MKSEVNAKKQIIYLLQVSIPFILLAFFKHPYFAIPVFIILLALPSPWLRKNLINGWMSLGSMLHKIVSPLIIGSLYFFVLTPLAIVRKAFGSDELHLKKPANTNFKDLTTKTNTESFEDLW